MDATQLTIAKGGSPPTGPHFQVAPASHPRREGTRTGPASAGELIRACRRIVLLTEGHSDPAFSKTAVQLLRYRPDDIAAVLDSQHAGATAAALLGVGGDIPVVGDLDEAPVADSLFVGISPPGGALPAGWHALLERALRRGLHVVSGLHTSLAGDPRLAEAAEQAGAEILDVRQAGHWEVARRPDFSPQCVRIHTVGADCSVGKMSAAKEIELGLRRRGRDAAFIATGQTGIMIAGSGIAVDGVVADFINGAAERLVLDAQHHQLLLIEGQGSIVHPAYSGVTTGLLHGCAPDGMILCLELGRERLKSMPHVATPPLASLIGWYEGLAGARHPAQMIGVAANGRRMAPADADDVCRSIEFELGLPTCDVYRHGPERLVDAVEQLDHRLRAVRGLLAEGAVTS